MGRNRSSRRQDRQTSRFIEFLNAHAGPITGLLVVAAIVLGFTASSFANDEQVSFEPTGSIYDIRDRVDEVFDPDAALGEAVFLIEDPDGVDVLTRDSLLEFKRRSDTLRNDTTTVLGRPLNARLVSGVDVDLGLEVHGIFSIADAVDAALAPGGLADADDDQVKAALAELLDPAAATAGLRSMLGSVAGTSLTSGGSGVNTTWVSPAFTALVRYDYDSFATAADEDQQVLDSESWLVAGQTVLRGGSKQLTPDAAINVWGIGIDFETAFEDSFIAGGPYIFLAVALIVMLVGSLMRSYWAAAVVAAGLSVTMMLYNGIVALAQLDQSPLLQLIVPISMISFGVDFFIHAAGRVREAQVEGVSRDRAYPVGMSAIAGALLLAAATSTTAFLSNAVSGVEAITEFGIAAAIALVLAYLVLGIICPRLLIGIEGRLQGRPADLGLMVRYKILFTIATVVAGVVVAMTVIMPSIGTPLFIVFIALFVYLPYRATLRRNRKALAAGRLLIDDVRGAGHGFRAAGSVVHFLARWRVITLPVIAVVAIIGAVLFTRVDRRFEFTDFLPENSEAIVGLNKANEYLPQQLGGYGYVYLEGDLTDPADLATIESVLADLAPNESDRGPNAASVVRAAMTSPVAVAAIESAGTTLSDDDGDGLPDDAAQVRAIYDYAAANGIPNAQGVTILRPDIVARYLYIDGATQGTRVEVRIPTFTDDQIIVAARSNLEEAADDLETAIDAELTLIGVSGPPIVNQDSLQAFIDSMLLSLPIAAVLAMIIAAFVMRSLRYAVTSIIPILLVVAWVYAFMYLVDLAVNPISATIAAIAVGVGIDFATHFTMRFREEFENEPSRFPALRRAGEGTGGALALSALTSIIGFWALSLAPTPIFATFGTLTAVMVLLALLVSLMVLPSLLLVVTPSRRGEDRSRLLDLHPAAPDYDPHSRETARQRVPTSAGGDE